MTLTPEQIDSRMAELGEVLFQRVINIIRKDSAPQVIKIQLEFTLSKVWERMKDVAEQAKKGREE